jgi:hypothetical protein
MKVLIIGDHHHSISESVISSLKAKKILVGRSSSLATKNKQVKEHGWYKDFHRKKKNSNLK